MYILIHICMHTHTHTPTPMSTYVYIYYKDRETDWGNHKTSIWNLDLILQPDWWLTFFDNILNKRI